MLLQVVTIAVYSFFLFSLIGEQILDPDSGHPNHTIDFYIPLFALLQLFFYIGWIKVAEALLNPFGSDDNDFEFIPLLERHLEVSHNEILKLIYFNINCIQVCVILFEVLQYRHISLFYFIFLLWFIGQYYHVILIASRLKKNYIMKYLTIFNFELYSYLICIRFIHMNQILKVVESYNVDELVMIWM